MKMKTMTNWLLMIVALVSLNTISFGQCSEPSWTTSAYSGGAKVSYEGKIYKAKWWTQNQTPGTNDVWEYIEDCIEEVHESTIQNLVSGQVYEIDPTDAFYDVEVGVNQAIDSISYVITDVNQFNQGNTRSITVATAPYTCHMPVILGGNYTIVRAIPYKNGSQGKHLPVQVTFVEKAQETLQAVIASPEHGTTIYLPENNPRIDVHVSLNQEVDSVLYAITEVDNNNFGNTKVLVERTAPYTLDYNNIPFGRYSIIRAIPYKNGSQGIIDENTVYFKKDIGPVISIVSPVDQEKVVVDAGDMIQVTTDISASEVSVDSILFIVVDAFASSGNVRRFTTYFPQTSLSFEGTPTASYTDIHVIAFGNGGRPSTEVTHEIFVEAKPTIELTTTADIVYNAANPETAFITVNANDVDGNVTGVHYRVTDGYGTFTYNTLASPFTMDYTPRITGDLTVHAIATDNDGHFSDTATYVFNVVEASTCSLLEWNSSSSYSGGAEVQYQGISYKANWWTTTNPADNNGVTGSGQPWTITTTCGAAARILNVVEAEEVSLDIYPNPTTGVFTLAIDVVDAVSVQVINAQGELVVETEGITSSTEFDLSNQASGVYFIKVIGANEVRTQKVIVE